MKQLKNIFLFTLLPLVSFAQGEKLYTDSLLHVLNATRNDSVRLDINRKLGFYHQDSNPDTAIFYHEKQLALAKKLNLRLWEADAYAQIASGYTIKSKMAEAYEYYMQGLKIAEDPSSAVKGWGYSNFSYSKSPEDARQSIIGMMHYELAKFYSLSRYYDVVFDHLLKAERIGLSLKNQKILCLTYRDMGVYYLNRNKPDSALFYYQKTVMYYQNSPYQKNLGAIYGLIGFYYFQKQDYDSAKLYYRNGIDESRKSSALLIAGKIILFLGNLYQTTGQLDSALYYTKIANRYADSLNDLYGKASSIIQLGQIYKLKKEYDVAYDYLNKGKQITDSLDNDYVNRLMKFQNVDFDQKIRLEKLEKEQQQASSRNRMYAMLAGLGIILLAAIFLYRNNLQKQKANIFLEKTLIDLKSTQSQLIQSEKMASLGELTAGIAHEIQNPLNFVNNFSEVNREMIVELQIELKSGNTQEAIAISNDIRDNEEKINHHGKRADAIVKGMLQHSRSSSGVKEPTDINKLADEYLRLAYHGLRAKDKSFNATMKTDFDTSIGKINIIPQDIGRVILNLITNAFFAVDEKKKSGIYERYEPTVLVSTKKSGDKISIVVKDNGNGIPKKIVDKIFQPFFTTKPTGQGTGLGLSLSYDIVKAHGGELKVESQEGEGAAFVIQLPVR